MNIFSVGLIGAEKYIDKKDAYETVESSLPSLKDAF